MSSMISAIIILEVKFELSHALQRGMCKALHTPFGSEDAYAHTPR